MNALVPTMAEQLRRLPPARIFICGLLYVLVVAVLDYTTPPGMSFSLFYLLGIVLVAWGAGHWPAVALSVVAALSVALAEQHAEAGRGPALVWVWNSLSRLVILVGAAWLAAELARLTRSLSALVQERTAQWQAEAQRHQATTARLSEVVERFEQIAENIVEVFWLFDPLARRFLYVSPGFERIWGQPCGELYARPEWWEESLHPEDRARRDKRPLREKVSAPYEAEYRIVRPDGTLRWVRDRAFPVRNPQGELTGIAGLAEDITERKRVEEALQVSQARLAQALDLAQLAHWEYDVAAGLFSFDERFYRLYGTSAQREGGSRMSAETYEREFLFPEDAQLVSRGVAAALATTEPNYLYQVEHRMRRRDGEIRHLAVRVSVTKDAAGRTVKIWGVNQDITERKRAEEALREVLELNRTLIAASPVGIAAYKASGECILANQALAHISGGNIADLLKQNFRELSSWQKSELLTTAEATLRTGQAQGCEFQGTTSFGKESWVSFAFASFTDRGAPHLLVLVNDITKRKRAERQVLEISDREQARIGQDLHDGLCQQLVGLAFDANTLVRQLDAEGNPETAIARRLADQLDQAITEARNVSRGLFPVRLEGDGLMSALEELATSTRWRHQVSCEVSGEAPSELSDRAKAIHLYRIAQEAVNNALKHAQPRSIRIELATATDQLRLRILDDGLGMRPGTGARQGLGLHIMDYRARTLGGLLNVTARPGGGTVVCCCVPRPPS